jgi:hypothetical protein
MFYQNPFTQLYPDPVFSHIDFNKPTIVLIDTSVALHKFSQCYAGVDHKDDLFLSMAKANFTALSNGIWLPTDVRATVVSTIFTLDIKQNGKYWRHDWLLDPANYLRVPAKGKKKEQRRLVLLEQYLADGELSAENLEEAEKYKIHYKAGRALPEYRFKKLKTNVYKWLEDGQLGDGSIGMPYYESDDYMAAIVDMNSNAGNKFNIIIYTVDADLIGLVNPSVTWVCMTGYNPGIRDTLETVNSWSTKLDAKGKMKLGQVDHWRDIWTLKGQKGDSSDNLPGSDGVLMPVIDLLDPPAEFNILKDPDTILKVNTILKRSKGMDIDKSKDAVRFIQSRGFSPSFRLYTDSKCVQRKVSKAIP